MVLLFVINTHVYDMACNTFFMELPSYLNPQDLFVYLKARGCVILSKAQ